MCASHKGMLQHLTDQVNQLTAHSNLCRYEQLCAKETEQYSEYKKVLDCVPRMTNILSFSSNYSPRTIGP